MSKIKRDYNVFWKINNNFNFFLIFQLDDFSLNFITSFIYEKKLLIIFNNFYQTPSNLGSVLIKTKITKLNNLKIYYFFFSLFFFTKKLNLIFNRNFFYFFIFNNTFFFKKKNFYINNNFFVAKFFFNFFINFNLFFNKLFFEVNLYKFKRTDYLEKNTYFLSNLFLDNNQSFYRVLDYSKVFTNSFLPDFNQTVFNPDIDKMSINLFSDISPNRKSYINFFSNDNSDDEFDIFKISNERIFNLKFSQDNTNNYFDTGYSKNCNFVSFFYLFNNLLKLLVFNNIDDFLQRKIEFFTYISFFDTLIFDNINIFLYYSLNKTYILNDIKKIKDCDLFEKPNYFFKLINNYKFYNNFFFYTYNISTYWDNSFFGISNYSSFNYLFILNNFFLKKNMFNFSFLKKNKNFLFRNSFKYLNFIFLKKNNVKYNNFQFNELFFIKFNFIVIRFINLYSFFSYTIFLGYFSNFFFFKNIVKLLNFSTKIASLGKVHVYFNNRHFNTKLLNYSSKNVILSQKYKLLNHSYSTNAGVSSTNFLKKTKFYVDVAKFMYYDNLNFSFYFLNFFKQFKYNVIYLLFTNRCSHIAAINLFKLSTSFNFFYFINLAPNIVTSSLGRSLYIDNSILPVAQICTNHTPIFFFSDFIKTKLLGFFKSSQISQFTFFYQYFLIQTLEFILNCKIYIKVFSLLKLVIFLKKNQFIQFIKSKYRYFNSKIGKGFFLVEVIEVFWITFLFKDTEFFMFWFTKTMGRLYYRKQKFFIYFLKIILMRHFCNTFNKLLNFKGFLFDIRGKVGVSGNSKKRHVQFNWGITSFTKKSLKLRYSHGLVFTYTGVMGTTFIITY